MNHDEQYFDCNLSDGRVVRVGIVRSARRRTICIRVNTDGIWVCGPRTMRTEVASRFVKDNEKWVSGKLSEVAAEKEEAETLPEFNAADINELAKRAQEFIAGRVKYYMPLVGVRPNRVTIRCQRKRWGSCSSKGNLNFNCMLMLTPPEVIDSVVVHELCHLKEMNHSKAFYNHVLRVFPDYYSCRDWLKKHGGAILSRIP